MLAGTDAGEYGITVDAVFDLLWEHSRTNNLKPAELCRAVVDFGLRIPGGA